MGLLEGFVGLRKHVLKLQTRLLGGQSTKCDPPMET